MSIINQLKGCHLPFNQTVTAEIYHNTTCPERGKPTKLPADTPLAQYHYNNYVTLFIGCLCLFYDIDVHNIHLCSVCFVQIEQGYEVVLYLYYKM